jgi:uncharacterized protein
MAAPGRIHLPLIQAKAELIELEPLTLPETPMTPADVTPLTLSSGELATRATLRTSSYTIYVDLPGNPDEMLLVHGYTGAYDRVSRRIATYLRSREAHHAPKPLYGDWTPEPAPGGEVSAPSQEDIAILKRRGYLVALTPEEEEALFVKISSRLHQKTLRGAPGYILMPTYQCNLRCHYCFQDHMRTDPSYAHLLRVMDRPMVDRILQGMQSIDAAHGIAAHADMTRDLLFFGGEPLLAESRSIIEYIMTRSREQRPTRFRAITNATELDAYEDLLGPDHIAWLQVTLDGTPAEHDQRRIYADGSGSFEKIAANVTMALARGVEVSIRLNIDRGNIDRLPALVDEFHGRGWATQAGFHAYVAPITGGNPGMDSRRLYNNWQLSRAMHELAQRHPQVAMLQHGDNNLRQQAQRIFASDGSMPQFRTSFCGAHTTMYVIDAFADIYACWERTGDPELRVGHIDQSGRAWMNRQTWGYWRGRNIVSNPVCRKCRYATACGGGCAALAEEASGNGYTNHCDGFAKRFRASVAEAYLGHLRGDAIEFIPPSACDM